MEQKKPRWEVKFEQYKKEGSKYAEMRKELKALKEGKVTGDFKTKQEYQDAVNARNKEIAEKEKLVQGYDNFKKNEGNIENILAYRNELQGKLENLPQDNKENIANKQAEIKKNEQTLIEQEKLLDELIQYVNSNPKSKDLVEKQEDLSITAAVVRNLKEQRGKLDGELEQLESVQKSYEEKVEPKKATYERKIAKCNIIAANLLKGKELGEFEIKVVPEDTKFKSSDGKFTEEVKKARAEQQNDKEEKTTVEEKDNVEAAVEESSFVEPAEKSADSAYNTPEIIEDEIENPEEDKAIAEVSDFATKYPRLAKAGNFFKNMGSKASTFFKNIGSKLSNLFKRKDAEELETVEAELVEESDKKEDLFEEIDETVKSQVEAEKEEGTAYKEAAAEELEDDIDYDEIIAMFKKGIKKGQTTVKKDEQSLEDKENEMLKAIAEKGRKEAFRDKLAVNKQQAAKNYAEKYGGTYERQDRATTKQEKQANDEGR